MAARAAILHQWLDSALVVYGSKVASLAASEPDAFRNPVGHALRTHLGTLLEQLLGPMDRAQCDSAFEQVIAIRALQDLTVEQAVGFVFALRGILRSHLPDADFEQLDARIDQLALIAFEQYLRARTRLAELRVNEQLRALGPLPYRHRAREAGASLTPGG